MKHDQPRPPSARSMHGENVFCAFVTVLVVFLQTKVIQPRTGLVTGPVATAVDLAPPTSAGAQGCKTTALSG